MYLPTSAHGLDVAQGHFLTEFKRFEFWVSLLDRIDFKAMSTQLRLFYA